MVLGLAFGALADRLTSSGTLLVTAGAMAAAVATVEAQERKRELPLADRVVPLSEPARTALERRLLSHPDVAGDALDHRRAVIRMTAGTITDASGKARNIVTAVLFDHTALEARRIVLDSGSGEVLVNDRLAGRPQSSRQEVAEAVEVIRRDVELARLLKQGGVLDGGFIVDDPAGSRRRAIQLKILSPDRRSLLRVGDRRSDSSQDRGVFIGRLGAKRGGSRGRERTARARGGGRSKLRLQPPDSVA